MKYKLINETVEIHGITLRRIEAVENFGNIKAGDKGGLIESEKNLSHDGDAWVYGNARVSGDAWVYGNARVSGDAQVKFDCALEFLVIGGFGSSERTVTATKTTVYAGCFEGNFAAFEAAVKEKYGEDYGGTKGGYATCIAILKNWMEL